jgi:general secretion pathway protein E
MGAASLNPDSADRNAESETSALAHDGPRAAAVPLPPAKTVAAPGLGSTPARRWLEFASYLARRHSIKGDPLGFPASARARKFGELWELTDLTANEFAEEVARFYDIARVDLPQLIAARSLAAKFSRRFLREMGVFPCQFAQCNDNVLVVADPNDHSAIRAAQLVLGGPVSLRIASFEDLQTILSERLDDDGSSSASPEAAPGTNANIESDVESLRDLASGAPVVRAVNDLLEKAVELRATDIHVEPFRTRLVLRMRIDGVLREVATPADILPQALISRIKILAGLNIAERRLPQDGAAHLRIARSGVDIRVATMPTQHGESAVIRLLPKDRGTLELAKLGLSSSDEAKIARLLQLPHGMIVVTGPTGSGKTTTLATMLTVLNDSTRKILTIEDPVEYEIFGINQSQVKPAIGLTFATALRAFVRQDPDVIMVGEVRDAETANIAIHAALTGHLVLTTLHTETAAAAVPRLLDLGVEGFLLQSTVRAMIAQRLVRLLCERCRAVRRLTASDLEADPRYAMLGFQVDDCVHEPRGCERCSGSGYRGRTGIFEVLEMDKPVRELIASRGDADTIMRRATSAGMTPMFDHAIAKVRAGLTSAAEVLRVTTR